MNLKTAFITGAFALAAVLSPLAVQAQPWSAGAVVARSESGAHVVLVRDRGGRGDRGRADGRGGGGRVVVRSRGGGGRGGWDRGPVVRFRYDDRRWYGGRWDHGWYDGRLAWWWIVDGFWFAYPTPVYPYPAYTYQEPVYQAPPVYQTQPAYEPPPPAESNWYYCDNPRGYYPYVSTCPGGWRAVPSTPSDR